MRTRKLWLAGVLAALFCSLPTGVLAQSVDKKEEAKEPSITYRAHVQKDGWQGWLKGGEIAGTTGQAKRLEGIEIKLNDAGVGSGIIYRTHVQKDGWQSYVSNGTMSGTTGQAKRVEAIQIKLTGKIAKDYDIVYRAHVQSYGWMDWAKNGAIAGTEGFGKRLEAVQIYLVEKGEWRYQYDENGDYIEPDYEMNYVSANEPGVIYSTHVQSIGWQDAVKDAATSGTTGQAKRVEAIQVKLVNPDYKGGIEYSTHVQGIGWQDWVADGAVAGTTGQAKRLEAIKIRLTGEMAEKYNVCYRAHVQGYGWLEWAKDGQAAGSEGLGKRLEAIQIYITKRSTSNGANDIYRQGEDPDAFITVEPKNEEETTAIGVVYRSHVQGIGWQSNVKDGALSGTTGQAKRMEAIEIQLADGVNEWKDGHIVYSTHIQGLGWTPAVVDGTTSGTTGQAKRLEAIEIWLTGDIGRYYDVYYRTHVQGFGWSDWASNGEPCGSEGLGKRMEGIQIQLVKKGEAAPAATGAGWTLQK